MLDDEQIERETHVHFKNYYQFTSTCRHLSTHLGRRPSPLFSPDVLADVDVVDLKLSNDSTRSTSSNESAYRYATPRPLHLDRKGETLFSNQNHLPSSVKKLDKSPVRQTTSATATSTPVEATATNPILQLAEAIANTTQIPSMSVTKFTGDPREYTRFVSRFTDQILSLPIHESRKLSCLIQYVDGDAKEAIGDFEGMGVGL